MPKLPEPSHRFIGLMHGILSIFNCGRRENADRVEMFFIRAKQSIESNPCQKAQAGPGYWMKGHLVIYCCPMRDE